MFESNSQLHISGLSVEVARKRVKCLRIAVYPGTGRIRVSAPLRTGEAALKEFVGSKIDWIRKHLSRGPGEASVSAEYVTGETHCLFGMPYRLEVEESVKARVTTVGNRIVFGVPNGYGRNEREALMDHFCRAELKKILPETFLKWEAAMGVKTSEWRIRKMKTKWGTCNVRDKRIWISLELAKKPLRAVEYVVVHELAHLIVRGHGPKFKVLMDRFYPDWRRVKEELNGTP